MNPPHTINDRLKFLKFEACALELNVADFDSQHALHEIRAIEEVDSRAKCLAMTLNQLDGADQSFSVARQHVQIE